MKKKFSLSLLVLIITGCILLSAGLVVGAYFLLKAQRNYTPPTATVGPTATLRTIVSSPQSTVTPGGPATPTPAAGELPASVASQMDLIQEQVSIFRGLSLKTELKRAMMTNAELKDVVTNEFFADYTADDAKNDGLELSTLGLLNPGFDLHQFYLDLYSEQIAGYYDSETKDMYVIGGEFTGLERMTYAHEFTHALQDQNYDLENGLKLNTEHCKTATEYCAAVTALVEGDATLSEQLWFLANATDQDRNDIIKFQQTASMPVYDSAPAYMKQDFLFPYQQGFDFVNQLYSKGKWVAVDAAFANPPVSAEQIMHPEKYPDDKPVEVTVKDILPELGADWTEYDRNTMGEWYTYLILSAGRDASFRLTSEDATKAADGWGGDTYLYLINKTSGKTAFVWLTTWDTQRDSNEFFSASQQYGSDRWGSSSSQNSTSVNWTSTTDGQVSMIQKGKQVLWAISADAQVFNFLTQVISTTGN